MTESCSFPCIWKVWGTWVGPDTGVELHTFHLVKLDKETAVGVKQKGLGRPKEKVWDNGMEHWVNYSGVQS